MKKSDLYREWARVLDMCEGTEVNPYDCWKVRGARYMIKPQFSANTSDYEFAVAILEGKPVFVGDKIYDKNGIPITVGILTQHILFNDEYNCSWSEPKKTFMLNGVELPCPDGKDDYSGYSLDILHKKFHKFYFKNNEDEIKVAEAIIKLLEDAKK